MKTIIPPLKSQGIKSKLVPLIKGIAPSFNGKWIEPFFGTGVVAFNLSNEDAILNDINPHIINFYLEIQSGKINSFSVREYLVKESRILRDSGNNGYDHYRFVRDRFNSEFNSFDFLFLSRAGFNGMMRFSKKGKWNIPFCQKPERFSTSYITKIANQVGAVSLKIKPTWRFNCKDFESVIANANDCDLIYCDPPYFGRYADYYNQWTENDEYRLQKILAKSPAKFILSTWHHNQYRKNHLIDELWSGFNIVTQEHFYHSGAKLENRQSMVEALIFNFDLDILEKSKTPDATIRHDILPGIFCPV